MADKPTVTMKKRTNRVVLGALMLAAAAIIIRLFIVSVLDNSFYQEKANEYHFGSITISASRGSIYDTNGVILAQSATVYKIYMDPSLFREEMAAMEETQKSQEKKKAAGKLAQDAVIVNAQEVKNEIVEFLAEKLEISQDDIIEAMGENTQYKILKTQVEKPVADEIIAFIADKSMNSISIEEDTKRYYPQDDLAASVIGFTNGDGEGQYGLEYQYDDYLSGTDGRVISAKDAYGNEMPYRYSKTYDAQDGNSLYLTIDRTLQYTLEKHLDEIVNTFDVENRACGIIMNAKTGAVLAMATSPGFDLNNPSEVADVEIARAAQDLKLLDVDKYASIPESDAQKYIKQLSKEEYKQAYTAAREQQWKNKAITELYIPGSVFKVVTSSAALEEDAISVEDHFGCNGSVVVVKGTPPIHCWKTVGHGDQSFTEAITHSCNPAFIEIGRRLGAEKFFQYFSAYGLTERTGIDLPAESTSYYQGLNGMGPIELASCSFGQTNKLTPMEMITAYAAVINGGELLTPYVVSKIVDGDGNVVLTNEKSVKRQVISEETSKIMCDTLEQVAIGNGAYIKGYHVGGKSGTSQKLDEYPEEYMRYISSYCCFAPADDPEVIMLLMADEPMSGDYYGSVVVVPTARKIMEEILPYMGYLPEYSDKEVAEMDVPVPLLEDMTIEEAKSALDKLELDYEIIGQGNTVYAQSPTTGSVMPKGGNVILYTDKYYEQQYSIVPDLTGMSLSQANLALSSVGLNYVATGTSSDNSGAVVQAQSETAGSSVAKGTVVEITFGVRDQSG